MICERLAVSVANYAYTILSLYRDNEEFRRTFAASKGFCAPHLRTVIEVAPDVLSSRDLASWVGCVFELQDAADREFSRQLEALAERYDYRSTEPVSAELRQALPRAIERLVGALERGNGQKR
jgi:hypothetical protein